MATKDGINTILDENVITNYPLDRRRSRVITESDDEFNYYYG